MAKTTAKTAYKGTSNLRVGLGSLIARLVIRPLIETGHASLIISCRSRNASGIVCAINMTADKTNRPIIQQYLSLAKPGVLLGNVITGAAGFGLASSTWRFFDPILFIATIVGMTLVI